jgi:uncharacterized protein (DUF488 family)
MLKQLFSIGHSNHLLDEFLALLAWHRIVALADIRRFPGSRKHPHFNQEELASALRASSVEYQWFEALGGRRRKQQGESSNTGLRNEGFRNYADYMLTGKFKKGVDQLLAVAKKKRTAMMCAEGLFWQCHRRLVSDFLLAHGLTVQHIMPNGELHSHSLTEGGKVADGNVSYPGEGSLFP